MPDLGRFIKILQCIEGEELELKIDTNSLKYSSKTLRFTYHLLHEGIIPSCPISVEKIKAINYQTSFSIVPEKMVEVVRCSTFACETSKIYFSTEDGAVFGELTDQQRANVDSIRLQLADTFKGEPILKGLPLQYETVRIITTSRCGGVNVLINNQKSVVTFEVTNENVKNLYISSGLTG